MLKTKYVIIGNGAAGISAADAISKTDKGVEILILTEENVPHYYRPKLIDFISGEADFKSFVFYDQDWYKDRNIKVIYNEKVIKINPEEKIIISENDNRYIYEKLLIASGGYAFVPPFFSEIKPLTVRSKSDADKVIEQSKENTNWCIIGGGLLGLELSNSLQKTGGNVSIVEVADYPLPRQLDNDGGDFLKSKIKSLGINLYTGVKLQEIKGRKVLLSDGSEIPFDEIIFCTGIRPNIEILSDTGIEIDKAVKINDYLETNIQDIFAAGDCSIHNGKMYGLWMPALEQGRLAGFNMAGKKTLYPGSNPVYKLKVVGVDVVTVGKIDTAIQVKSANKLAGVYRKAFIENENLVGFILYGDISGENELKKNLNKDFSQSEEYFDTKESSMSNGDTYVCDICGYIYDPAKGDSDSGVAPGTAFKDLPDGWNCPVCGAPVAQFSKE